VDCLRRALPKMFSRPTAAAIPRRASELIASRPSFSTLAGCHASAVALQGKTIRGRLLKSLLPLRPELVHRGRCVQACQTVEVSETLSIGWELDHPRVLWDGAMKIGGSSCVSCGHCVTVYPCNALMERSMLGEAGFMSGLPKAALDKMIDVVKDIEPEMGYTMIMQVSQTEAKMREERVKQTKTVCTFCGVGCGYDVWTKERF
jgi:ferredoxin